MPQAQDQEADQQQQADLQLRTEPFGTTGHTIRSKMDGASRISERQRAMEAIVSSPSKLLIALELQPRQSR